MAILLVPVVLSGCYYAQPGNVGQGSALNGTTATAGILGAAGGAFAGNAIDKNYGAPIGAAVGGLALGGAAYILEARKQRELAEAYEEGQRKGRAQVYEEWWDDVAIFNDPADQAGKHGPKTRQVPLPAGDYESVPYLNRTYEYIVSPK